MGNGNRSTQPSSLTFGLDAFRSLAAGLDIVAAASSVSLGPGRRAIIIEQPGDAPLVCSNGLLRAGAIELKNARQNLGAQLLWNATRTIRQTVGDGSATCAVLSRAMMAAALKSVSAGADPLLLRRGMLGASQALFRELQRAASRPQAHQVAQIAALAARDRAMGELIGTVLTPESPDGLVVIEDATGTVLEVEMETGLRLRSGYASYAFVTDADSRQSILDDPLVLVSDEAIVRVVDILPALESLVQITRKFVVVSKRIEGEALSALVVNKLRGTFDCLAVNTQGLAGLDEFGALHDVARLTGATLLGLHTGRGLRSIKAADFGRARRVIASEHATTFLAEARPQELEALGMPMACKPRPVVRIKVGAATELERKAKRTKVEVALAAARAALDEGVVPGGGVALVRAAQAIRQSGRLGDEAAGASIVFQAVGAPLMNIAANAGLDGAHICTVVGEQTGDFGFDVETHKYGSMANFGILDPTKVVRVALESAVGVVALALTSAVLVTSG